ncbi:MAG: hypothetical protein AAGD00_00270 [Planctomycetota bacterium]
MTGSTWKLALAGAVSLAAGSMAHAQQTLDAEDRPSPGELVMRQISTEADRVLNQVEEPVSIRFLEAIRGLPEPIEVSIWFDPRERDVNKRRALTAAQHAQATDEEKAGLALQRFNPFRFYFTSYGTPVAYVRTLEVAGKHGMESIDGAHVLDFGYGSIGQLRAMASLGATAVGVDIDDLLAALYDGQTGAVARHPVADVLDADGDGVNEKEPGAELGANTGRVAVFDGYWPAEKRIADDVRGALDGAPGYDLITSKNTLKKGFIHPPEGVEARVDLRVSDEAYLMAVRESLVPGGLFVIYNLHAKTDPPGPGFRPWTDGRCPFSRETMEEAGFEVLAYNADDTESARAMGVALGWDAMGMNVEGDLFATYTVVKRPDAGE